MADVRYAGFWIRVGSYLIDVILLGIVNLILNFILGRETASLLEVVISWLYFSLMESSNYQGTLGKMIVGVKVTTLEGEKIGFGRATARYFSKILSGIILCIGYMMAGWTTYKQALHDMIAGTVVVKK